MSETSYEVRRILDILDTIDSELDALFTPSELAEIADKLQEVLNNIQEYLFK